MLDRMLLASTASEALYVEDVFSTWLYTGNGATQTITNGIDFSGKGGLVWFKNRNNTTNHILFDTVRNAFALSSNLVNAQDDYTGYFSFNSNGFSVGAIGSYNANGNNIASWSFRKAPKFFDVVTYSGDGNASKTISHNLGVAPGLIIVKRTNSTDTWKVYHRGLASPNTSSLTLNSTAAVTDWGIALWGQPSATSFDVNNNIQLNTSGGTYVAYLFAHDATADGIIQCGSLTTDSSGIATANLGWEPQYIMVKPSSTTGNWVIYDNMRGLPYDGGQALYPNLSNSEVQDGYQQLQPTGFRFNSGNAVVATYIYIAIRRGPMKTPTLGTSVFKPITRTGTGGSATVTGVGFSPDMLISRSRNNGTGIAAFGNATVFDRLRGVSGNSGTPYLMTPQTQAENSLTNTVTSLNMDGYSLDSDGSIGTVNYSADENYINYAFKRAPSFFDEVCYTGTGAARTVNHNLGVAPELWIVKRRDSNAAWPVGTSATGTPTSNHLILNSANAMGSNANEWTTPTATTFGIGTAFPNDNIFNASGGTYVAYLFASCPGVSKVFSFTGNGSSQTINCGFSNGARFVMIKRTDAAGDWYVWDTARGIVAANDPHLSLNTTAAEVTTNDTIDPDSTGFIVNQVAATNVNVNGATYIYLAIA